MVHSRSACVASVVALCLAVGCVSEEKPQTTGEYVLEMCGPMPQAPGTAASFDGERVEISRDTYTHLQDYRIYVTLWSACVASLP